MTNAQLPSYSGVTINISNPTVNANPYPNVCSPFPVQTIQPQKTIEVNPIEQQPVTPPAELKPQAYPPEYYLNNYNLPNRTKDTVPATKLPENTQESLENVQTSEPEVSKSEVSKETIKNEQEDMSASTDIINKLDEETAKQKELEEKGKQTRVIALTDEYIMSLENYLNNPNTEIRVMAAKEILTRLDEDKSRYDDAALNALLNKMLQDPQKLVRIAALSALSSGLASGNDYTVELLNNIQQNPNSDKEDVVEAANILLKMSADTEIKYVDPNSESTVQRQQNLEKQLTQQQKIIEQMQQKNKAEQ